MLNVYMLSVQLYFIYSSQLKCQLYISHQREQNSVFSVLINQFRRFNILVAKSQGKYTTIQRAHEIYTVRMQANTQVQTQFPMATRLPELD